MSADKDPIRSAHETLALIADKLSVDRSQSGDGTAPDKPVPPAATTPAPAAASATPESSAVPPPDTPSPAPEAPTAQATTAPAATPPAPPPPAATAAVAPPMPVPVQKTKLSQRPQVRDALLTYFPMLIAVMSLALSIYQGYLFNQSLDIMQKNVARAEYIRTCREIIETYFVVKQKVGVLMPAADRGNVAGASRVSENNRLDAQAAIAKFGGLGTYLANFQDVGTRARYTDLTKTLGTIMDTARNTQLPDIDKLFAPAEKLFAQMNDDCARLARAMRM